MEHELEFVQGLQMSSKMRKHMFDAIEQRVTREFWNTNAGRGLYEDILLTVRKSGVADAVSQFENRFLPLVNSKPKPREADDGPGEDITRTHDRHWPGILVLCLAAVLTALALGFNATRMTSAEAPGLKRATIANTGLTELVPETVPEPPQAVADESTVSDTDVTNPTSETVRKPEPETSLEENLSSEDSSTGSTGL